MNDLPRIRFLKIKWRYTLDCLQFFTREHRTIGKKVGKENSTRESYIRLIWHQQSIEIQQQFNKSIAELKEGMDQHQKQLEKIEEDIISRERSKLRDRLLQSHRYFTSPEKNPLHAWSEMEADAFWSMFKEYENAKGNGHMHTVVQPEMRALEVIPMHEDAKIAELMGSRK